MDQTIIIITDVKHFNIIFDLTIRQERGVVYRCKWLKIAHPPLIT